MKKLIALAAIASALGGAAFAEGDMNPRNGFFNLKAGFIADNNAAQQICPQVCSLSFNGGWVTKIGGKTSICNASDARGNQIKILDKGAFIDVGIDAGPIWNNGEAGAKCNAALSKVGWSGQWTNDTGTNTGEAICGCNNATAYTWRPNTIEQ